MDQVSIVLCELRQRERIVLNETQSFGYADVLVEVPLVKLADRFQLSARHTLRHTAITHLVQAGVDLPTVQRISGHKTLIMVARYAHQNGEHLQAAMDKLQQRYQQTG